MVLVLARLDGCCGAQWELSLLLSSVCVECCVYCVWIELSLFVWQFVSGEREAVRCGVVWVACGCSIACLAPIRLVVPWRGVRYWIVVAPFERVAYTVVLAWQHSRDSWFL